MAPACQSSPDPHPLLWGKAGSGIPPEGGILGKGGLGPGRGYADVVESLLKVRADPHHRGPSGRSAVEARAPAMDSPSKIRGPQRKGRLGCSTHHSDFGPLNRFCS